MAAKCRIGNLPPSSDVWSKEPESAPERLLFTWKHCCGRQIMRQINTFCLEGDHTNTTDLTHLAIGLLNSILVSFKPKISLSRMALGVNAFRCQAIIVSQNKLIFRDTYKKTRIEM